VLGIVRAQVDLYGVNGFLEALPSTPALSLHHMLANPPIFPDMDRMGAIRRLVQVGLFIF
jgi:hypothetical protein